MPTEYAYSSGHLVLSHFGTCMCSNVETHLSWTLNFEHPSVLLFSLRNRMAKHYNLSQIYHSTSGKACKYHTRTRHSPKAHFVRRTQISLTLTKWARRHVILFVLPPHTSRVMREWDWLLNVTCNVISVIYLTAHRCAGGLKKLNLRSGSQRHIHFVGFLNVPIQAPTRGHPFYTGIPRNRPYSRLLRQAGETEDQFSS